jgi:voltage-gated potassium channel
MFVTVIAKTLNPAILVVARSEHEASESPLLKAGANRVATPNVIGGRRLANYVLRPFASDYFDLVTHGHDAEFRLQDVELPVGSPLVGQSIRQAMVRDRYGTYIFAIRHPDGTVDTNPSMDTVMLAGSVLVVIGTTEQIAALAAEV